MLYLAMIVLLFAVLRFIVAAANLFGRQWLQPGTPERHPTVSILVPARNEEKNIGQLLDTIRTQSYPHWEALVYDDLSEDRTADIVAGYSQWDRRIRYIPGTALPPGWLGKNHACFRLAQQASGDCFLFVDADVKMEPHLLRDAMAHFQRRELAFLSIFPKQIMHSIGEKISVPLMHWILVSLLPLALTHRSKNPALSAANGQCLLIDARVYRNNRLHETFKNIAAEDIAIARHIKRKGMPVHTILSRGQIQCRMYRSLRSAIEGFSKNFTAYFGSSTIAGILFVLLTTTGIIPVWIAMGPYWAMAYLVATTGIRIIVSLASAQNVLANVAGAPLQQIVCVAIIGKAITNKMKKKTLWKGRNIYG